MAKNQDFTIIALQRHEASCNQRYLRCHFGIDCMKKWIKLLSLAMAVLVLHTLYNGSLTSVSLDWLFNRQTQLASLTDYHSNRHKDGVCSRLLLGNDSALQKWAANHSEVPALWMPDDEYVNATCNDLRRGYILDEHLLPPQERSLSIAFAIHMYKDVWQSDRLLKAIYRPHHFYCFHVDNRSSETVLRAVTRLASCLGDNVVVTSNRSNVDWGTIRQVHAELACMRELLLRFIRWKYFINLTGQEYPLKTMWQLVQILLALNGANSMEGTLKRINDERREQLMPFAKQFNLQPIKGAIHIVVVRRFVEYMLYNEIAQAMLLHLDTAAHPDETFFATLNHNPALRAPGAYLGEPETHEETYPFINRLKNWGDMPCHGYYRNAICIWAVEDLPFVTSESRKQLFVNKLFWDYQHFTLDCLEFWYWRNTLQELKQYWTDGKADYNVTYYKHLDISKNHVPA